MSWQRIFETARKQGIPVIVTDGLGRDPLVILPLEQFEALTESNAKEPVLEPLPEPPYQVPSKTPSRPEPVIQDQDPVQHVDEKKLVSELMPGLSTEERFYLEPVEDSWSEPRV